MYLTRVCDYCDEGPQCVLSCAKEGRPLPQGGFTCCLAMDGLKVLASGFLIDEKVLLRLLLSVCIIDILCSLLGSIIPLLYRFHCEF